MAEELTRFTLGDGGGVVLVETQDPAARIERAGRAGKSVAEAAVSLRDALGPVTAAASDVLAGFQSMAHRPDEVEIRLGVNFDASFGMVIANASAGATLEVTLRWSGEGATPPQEGVVPASRIGGVPGETTTRSA